MVRRTACLKALLSSANAENDNMNDALLDTTKKFSMLGEGKDIVEELQMIEEIVDDRILAFKLLETARLQVNKRDTVLDYLNYNSGSFGAEDGKTKLAEMSERAKIVTEAILQLLQPKQQQASISEARSSRKLAEESSKQSHSIMLFTVITILFLPLSTFASIFGINAVEFG